MENEVLTPLPTPAHLCRAHYCLLYSSEKPHSIFVGAVGTGAIPNAQAESLKSIYSTNQCREMKHTVRWLQKPQDLVCKNSSTQQPRTAVCQTWVSPACTDTCGVHIPTYLCLLHLHAIFNTAILFICRQKIIFQTKTTRNHSKQAS